ncbi:hypothetical protein TPB0596_10080 [Tsukamurella pulmonis]|uniref:hypothetical protein n=1 Tax=Tsukamurella pulmonis TaxID=47312 RepID=UPI001EDCF6E9|nr:hypothetical protein [Tsukamurella pulmonis]BDD81245.1 hypothetical protein TPB0596_10080 [Tsukamurella pulmonis]
MWRLVVGFIGGAFGASIAGIWGFFIPVAASILWYFTAETDTSGVVPDGAAVTLTDRRGSLGPAQAAWNRAAQGANWGVWHQRPGLFDKISVGGVKFSAVKKHREWQIRPGKTVFVPHFAIVGGQFRADGDMSLVLEPTHDGLHEAPLQSFVPIGLAEFGSMRIEGEVHRHHDVGQRYSINVTNTHRPLDDAPLLKTDLDEWM